MNMQNEWVDDVIASFNDKLSFIYSFYSQHDCSSLCEMNKLIRGTPILEWTIKLVYTS